MPKLKIISYDQGSKVCLCPSVKTNCRSGIGVLGRRANILAAIARNVSSRYKLKDAGALT